MLNISSPSVVSNSLPFTVIATGFDNADNLENRMIEQVIDMNDTITPNYNSDIEVRIYPTKLGLYSIVDTIKIYGVSIWKL